MTMKQPELGQRIAELRKAKGLTQEELVELCHLSSRTLQRIESGEVMPRQYTFKAILTALDHQPDNAPPHRPPVVKAEEEKPRSIIRQTLEFFNLKNNTMKKLSILSLILFAVFFMMSNRSGNAQDKPNNPLVGKWRLISLTTDTVTVRETTTGESTTKILAIQGDITPIRILEFTTELTFNSKYLSGWTYNQGIYAVTNNQSFITVHNNNGKLEENANLYNFKIVNDTLLHFYGYYTERLSCIDKLCKMEYVDEWWVKVPEKQVTVEPVTGNAKKDRRK